MPLPPPVPRQALHQRGIELRGYARADGRFDIEAQLRDTRPADFTLPDGRVVPAGEALHDMGLRLVLDADLVVCEVQASTDAAPYGVCREAPATLQRLVGLRVGAGWSRAVAERLGGPQGCTHLMELLKPLATVALLSLSPLRQARALAASVVSAAPEPAPAARPAKIDSCYAYASHREIVRERWPAHFTGQGRD